VMSSERVKVLDFGLAQVGQDELIKLEKQREEEAKKDPRRKQEEENKRLEEDRIRKEELERQRREEEKRLKKEEDDKKHQAELARMQEQRERKERERQEVVRPPPTTKDLDAATQPSAGKYIPPSKRRMQGPPTSDQNRAFSDSRFGRERYSSGPGYGGDRYNPSSSSRYDRDRDRYADRDRDKDRDSFRRDNRPPPEPRNTRWN